MTTPVAVVTGAGSGVGEQIAHQLHERGYAVVLVGRTREKLESVARELGGRTLVLAADVGENDDRARIVSETLGSLGRIDALVNNAGLALSRPLHKHDPATMERLFRINGFGPVDLARRVLDPMVKQGSGVIVSVASMANIDPFPGLGMYGCAKGALGVLPKAIENEYAKKGIRAYTVCPGAIETGMLRSMFSEKVLPTSATLAPEDVASRVVACVTGSCEESSGSVIEMPSH